MPIRADAFDVGFIERALTQVMPELERTEFQEYMWADMLVPMDERVSPGVDQIEYYRLTYVGAWQLVRDYTNNVNPADFYLEKVVYPSHYFGQHYSYTTQQLDRISFARRNAQSQMAIDITREKYMAVEEGFRQLKNRLFSLGDPDVGIFGALTHPDVPRLISPYTLGFAQTADENLAVLNLMVRTIVNSTNKVERPDVLLLPILQLEQLQQQRMSTAADKSVIQYFLETNSHIQYIDSVPELSGAGPAGEDLAIAYRRDSRKMVGSCPKPMTMIGPPQPDAYQLSVYFDAQVSGVHYKRPLSALIMEGV